MNLQKCKSANFCC